LVILRESAEHDLLFTKYHSFLLNVGNVSAYRRETQNTHFIFNTLLSKNRAVYELMWNNMVEPERQGMAIKYVGMRLACWISTTTNTGSEYAIFIAFSWQKMVTRTRLNVALCISCIPFRLYLQFIYQSGKQFRPPNFLLDDVIMKW